MAKTKPSDDPVLTQVQSSPDDGICNRCEARKLAGERFLLESGPLLAEWLCQDCFDAAKAA